MTRDWRAQRREIRAQRASPERLLTLAQLDVTLARLIAQQSRTPIPVLEDLARHPDVFTRRKVAGNVRTPADTLRTLAAQRRFHILKAVAGNPNTPADVIDDLARHPHHTVRIACLENRTLSFNRYYELAHDPHPAVQTAWLAHELELIRAKVTPLPTPGELSEWLDSAHLTFRRVLARSLHLLPPDQQTDAADALLDDNDPVIREHVILYASEDQQNPHARDPSPWVRGVIAARTTDPDLYHVLLHDPDQHVRRAAARNPQHTAHPGAHP
ncbi:hypothetical protein [Deinococcus sedimenti]|uniref:HEAT repeat domain-containing protein n=1 Tax=Deinococcus sedimenti TaxID=1867090 RepID=A0ABQ2S4J4_9DEIO|nr:hypothetical protein [Deinococcus sedimenti]GGR87757.1 hypothetical protein GCM10008960_13510 [Deinococcus sedimenti]